MLTKEHIDAVANKLKDLPPVVKSITLADAIKQLTPSIRKLQEKGYTLEQIVQLLKTDNITVSVSTLKRLCGPVRKRRTKAQAPAEKPDLP